MQTCEAAMQQPAPSHGCMLILEMVGRFALFPPNIRFVLTYCNCHWVLIRFRYNLYVDRQLVKLVLSIPIPSQIYIKL